MIVIVMGVSGSGKTTVGKLLARQLSWRFIEGDDYHPADNLAKMSAAIPLNDEDRRPWLDRLTAVIERQLQTGRSTVLSCSALKRKYREKLLVDPIHVRLVYLCGSYDLILERLKQRVDHFMHPELLKSQFNALEQPRDALAVNTDQPAAAIVARITEQLSLTPAANETRVVLEDLMFPEAPRWRDGWLWFTDQHARRVVRVTPQGESETLATLDDLPGGLGWLADGRLLVVSMTRRQVLVLEKTGLNAYADLSRLASFHCNDMLVDGQGRCYVGNFGFDLHGGAPQHPAELILVESQDNARIVADELIFPNGCALTRDGDSLLVAETFASRITAFDIEPDGSLSNRRLWAELGGAYPDGICLDPCGDLWVAAPNRSMLLLVREGGEILRRVRPLGDPYACMLGGDDGDILFITSSETDDPVQAKALRSGRIETLSL
ncbi:MAG: SMP-30/gluconolactonase/LRE family protein [Candidatus Thiodiazotropha sp. (ex Dulcina madagascariensis)]|nr:SMP-30/gluconolactonase/LRE family protein [Candidatus Thiodiazotropha sp. (ex Dulcina madagascariensis)]